MTIEGQTSLARINIRNALAFRGFSSFDASIKLNKNRSYLDDFLRERKQSISNEFIQRLSALLDVDRSYIEGIRTWPENEDEEIVRSENTKNKSKQDIQSFFRSTFDFFLGKSVPESDPHDDPVLGPALNQLGTDTKELVSKIRKIQNKAKKYDALIARGWLLPLELTGPQVDAIDRFHLFRIYDRSMSNADDSGFSWGDYAVIDLKDHDFNGGGAFLIRENGKDLFRMLELIRDGGESRVRLRPLNINFPVFEVPLSDIEIVGKAIVRLSRL